MMEVHDWNVSLLLHSIDFLYESFFDMNKNTLFFKKYYNGIA